MDTLRTAFRLVVMLVAIGIGYKAWQHFGPPADELKSFVLRALDAARTALDSPNDGDATALTADPRPMAPTFGAPMPTPVGTGQVMQAQALVPADALTAPAPISPPALATPPSVLPAPNPPESDASLNTVQGTAGPDEDPLKSLYSRLEQLGARGPQLAAWGNGGQMYRFSCQASPAGIENFNRHFDAIASDPQAAVEAVIAKVEAWRNAQNDATPSALNSDKVR